jgi:NhaA family Na+:H+ antiporter
MDGMLEGVRFIKTERGAALLLLVAAVCGFVLANNGGYPWLENFLATPILGRTNSPTVHQLVFDYGLSVFFFVVGLELKREFTSGALKPIRNAIAPTLAAVFGVLVPAGLYSAFNFDQPTANGWPIPTATDVTFALAVFVLFGRSLPKSARTFLLAFAVIDDLLAVVILSVVFSGIQNWWSVLGLVGSMVGWWLLVTLPKRSAPRALRVIVGAILWLVSIRFAMSAGVEPALVAVGLALLTPPRVLGRLESAIHPYSAYLAVPLFAFFAAAVPVRSVDLLESAVFWGILFRPLGKLIGVFVGGRIGMRWAQPNMRFSNGALARVSLLGGIGFTVSLLMAGYAFRGNPVALGEAVVATFIAAGISAAVGAVWLLRSHRA